MGFIVWFFGGLAFLVILSELTRFVFKEKYNDAILGQVYGVTAITLLMIKILLSSSS